MTKRLDPEIKVIRAIGRALRDVKTLDRKAQRRVLGWTSEKAYSEMRNASNQDSERDS